VACAIGPSITTGHNWFLGFTWIFTDINHLKINICHILNPNLTNKIPSNPAHQDLANNTNGTFQFLRIIFQLQFNLIFGEESIQYSRTFTPQVQMSWNQVHAPLPVESFPKAPRTWSEAYWFSGSHNFKTKENKVPS
jgi:hypothetical protein